MVRRERLFHSTQRPRRHLPLPLALVAPQVASVAARQVTQQRHRARDVPDRAGADVQVGGNL